MNDEVDQQAQAINDAIVEAYPTFVDGLESDPNARRLGVDDVAQEACARTLNYFRKHPEPCENMLAYLWTTARNYIAERARAELDPEIGRILEPLTDALLDQVEDPGSAFPTEGGVIAILEGYIDRGIADLPDRQKTALMLHLKNPDNTHDQNATLMGIQRQPYERLLRKAQTKLRAFLETECPNVLGSRQLSRPPGGKGGAR